MSSLFAILFAFTAIAQYPGSTGLTSTDVQDDRAVVRRRVESFEKLVKDAEKDAEAVGMLDGMIAMFKESGVRDRGRILKTIVASVKVSDVPKDKTKSRNLPIEAADRMSQMGVEAFKPIVDLINDRKIGLDLARITPLTAGLVKLGIGTPEALDMSLKMLDDSNPRLFAGLVPAFATMDLETQAKRKRIAGAILSAHETIGTRIEKDKAILPDDKPKFTDSMNIATITTLNALAGQKLPDVAAFRTWHAENKDKDWPDK